MFFHFSFFIQRRVSLKYNEVAGLYDTSKKNMRNSSVNMSIKSINRIYKTLYIKHVESSNTF